MYLVLTDITIPRLVRATEDPADALDSLEWARQQGDLRAVITEVLIPGADPRTAIPGELDRAIDAWNLMCDRFAEKLRGMSMFAKVKKRERLVKPYRNWTDAIRSRDYMLEQLIPDIEAQPFLYSGSFAFTFAWLFGQKKGEWNSDKVHARAYGGNGNGGNGAEKEYLGLARRVGTWQKEHDFLYAGGGDVAYASAFEAGTGISLAKWEALREKFNGSGKATI